MILICLSALVHEILIWTFLIHFWVDDITTAGAKLKSGSHLPNKNCVICLIEIPLKMMKNPFYFILKALFSLRIFKFLSWLFGNVGNIYFNLYLQIRLTSKFMTSQPGFQTMAIYLLPTISQIKGNQAMKFGQLIK